jgi:hypothetical protein
MLKLSSDEVKTRQVSDPRNPVLPRRNQLRSQTHPASSASHKSVMPEVEYEVYGPILWLVVHGHICARETEDHLLGDSPVADTTHRGAESSCLGGDYAAPSHCILDNEGVCLSAEARDRMNGLRPCKIHQCHHNHEISHHCQASGDSTISCVCEVMSKPL